MGIMYVFAVTGFFGLVAIAWALYEGHKMEQNAE